MMKLLIVCGWCWRPNQCKALSSPPWHWTSLSSLYLVRLWNCLDMVPLEAVLRTGPTTPNKLTIHVGTFHKPCMHIEAAGWTCVDRLYRSAWHVTSHGPFTMPRWREWPCSWSIMVPCFELWMFAEQGVKE